ncbi:toxin-antitoxin system YwqK family antitoxin [Lacinutrix undariae]
MKNIYFILSLFVTSVMVAQTVNQFDKDGKRHGIWKKDYNQTDQIRYQGTFDHGKEIGVFNYYTLNKGKSVLSAVKTYTENSNIAEVKFLSSKGKIISQGQMNGKLYAGTWTYYHRKSAAVMSTESYNNQGELEGEKLVFYDNGQVAERLNYVNGKIEGVSTWYSEKGIALKIFTYKNNELHGSSKYYDIEGVLLAEGDYKHDLKHGIWKYYEDGKLKEEKDYTKKSNNPYKQ